MTRFPRPVARIRLTALHYAAAARTYLCTKTPESWARVVEARRVHYEAKVAHGEWLDAAIHAAVVDS